MKSKPNISAYLFLLSMCSLNCFAQSELYLTTIDLNEPSNAAWIKPSTDKIGDMLLDGYMSGKLRGFTEGIVERLEYAPVPPENLPREWEKGRDYWIYDLVSYNGLYYECWSDKIDPNLPPFNNKQWKPHTLEGDLISRHWEFPDVRDTLSKTELLDRLTIVVNESFMSWQSGVSYYTGDLVEYNGYNYQAMMDVTSSKPPSDDKENWVYHPNMMSFMRPSEMNVLQIFSGADKRVLQPQILGLSILRPEGYDQRVIYFYYEEAVNYLGRVRQPVLYRNQYGYFGANELVLDEQSRINVLQQIKILAKAKPKAIIAGVTDNKIFSDFQNDPAEVIDLSRWKVMQSLDGTKFQVSDDRGQHFLSVPASSLKKIVSKGKVALATYAGMIQAGKFMMSTDPYPDIPEKPRTKALEEVARIPKDLCFRESYIKVLDSVNDLTMLQLWKKIDDINKAKPIPQINSDISFFPSTYDWTKQVYSLPSKGDFKFDKDFQVGHPSDTPFVIDTLITANHIPQYTVTYEKSAGKFQPLTFSILVEANDSNYNNYTFDWKVIRPILESSGSDL